MVTRADLLLLLKVVEWNNPEFRNDFNVLEYARVHELIEREIENAHRTNPGSVVDSPLSNWSPC